MSAWTRGPDGRWFHRPWWKVLINTPLRWLQRGRSACWLVYTESTTDGDPPTVVAYGFGLIPMWWHVDPACKRPPCQHPAVCAATHCDVDAEADR